jgi:hypothetical protein
MNRSRLIELTAGPAICRCATAADRGSACRLLAGRQPVPAIALPDITPVSTPGRVFSLGRFRDQGIDAALTAALPIALRGSLRTHFEWHACRGAFFHNDAHYGDVLFGAWCVAGPPREIVFARAGVRVPATRGDWVLFDPFEPHAVLDEGADCYERSRYANSPVSVFIGFELNLDVAVREAFGIDVAQDGAPVLSSGIAVNAESGALH